MERWCPRCEWVGASEHDACPRCDTPLIEVEAPKVPLPAMREPPSHRAAPAGGEPEAAEPGANPETTADGSPRPNRKRLPAAVWLALPAAVLAAVGLTALRHHVATAVSSATGKGRVPSFSVARPKLPSRLMFVTSGLQGGPGPLLFTASGDGGDVQPVTGGRFVATFAESPDGSRSAIVDFAGRLRLEPRDLVYNGPVTTVTFSPDGRTLAACTGTWPPHLILLTAEGTRLSARDEGKGCDAEWSANGAWLAYRVPGRARETFMPGRVGVLDVLTGRRHRIRGDWPVAWAPSGRGGPDPLTLVSAGGVVAVDPSTGGRRQLVALQRLLAIRSPRRTGPVTMLAWSPDGKWLAVGFGRGPLQDGAVFLVDPRTQQSSSMFFAHSPNFVDATTPISFSWSRDDRLLVGFSGRGGSSYSQIIGPTSLSATLSLELPSWSPDGRWVLGRSGGGWIAVDPTDPSRRVLVGPSQPWARAEWCCPPVPTVYAEGSS